MVVDEAWVELKTEDGRTYFWHRRDNQRAWALPEGRTVKWVGQKAPDGRTYYWSRGEVKETVWVLPPLPPLPGESRTDKPDQSSSTGDEGGEGAATTAPAAAEATSGTREAVAVSAAVSAVAAIAADAAAEAAAAQAAAATLPAAAPKLEEPEDLLCCFPELEPSGPTGESASAVAARHVLSKSGFDSWWRQLPTREWEEVVRFWPPADDLDVAKAPKLRRPKPDPFGIRELVIRCQSHEEIVRALLVAQFGSDANYTTLEYPCPQAKEWCFWTSEGKQLLYDAEGPVPLDGEDEGMEGRIFFKRSLADGERWRLIKPTLRTSISFIFRVRRLRKLERAMRKSDKSAVQAMLDKFGTEVPEKLAKEARKLTAPPPKLPHKAAPPAAKEPPLPAKPAAPVPSIVEPGAGPAAAFSKGIPSGSAPLLSPTPPPPKGGPPTQMDAGTSTAFGGVAPLPPPPGGPPGVDASGPLQPQSVFGAPGSLLGATGMGAMPGLLPPLGSTAPFAPLAPLPPPPAGGLALPGGVLSASPLPPPPTGSGPEVPQQPVQTGTPLPTKAPPPAAGSAAPVFKAPPPTPGAAAPGPAPPQMPPAVTEAGNAAGSVLPGGFTIGGHGGAMFPTKAPPPSATPAGVPVKAAAPGPLVQGAAPEPPVAAPAASGTADPADAAAAANNKRKEEDGLLSALAAEAAPWAARKRRRGRAAGDEPAGPALASVAAAAAGLEAAAGNVAAAAAAAPAIPAPADEANARSGPVRFSLGAIVEPRAALAVKGTEPPKATSDRSAAERIAAVAERVAAATNLAAGQRSSSSAAPQPEAQELPATERLRRKVVVSNISTPVKANELADFFTGAIFSATGHRLAAQWQSGEASKVVVAVDMVLGLGSQAAATSAEVTFGTHVGATVAVAMNGIQFKGKALEIRRPKGYTGQAGARTKLTGISIKDIVASDGTEAVTEAKGTTGKPARRSTGAPGGSTSVSLSGIPASMGSKSVFDLLEQFGGKLQSLNLGVNQTGGHDGHGMAVFRDPAHAAEAVRFSPLLGFIEVKMDSTATEEAPKRQRRSRFDPEPASDAAPVAPAAPTAGGESEPVDLGPFEAVLANKRASDDLGPFEAVLQTRAATPQDDLGPFEAVLPPKPAEAALPPKPSEDDLAPFSEVLAGMQPAASRASSNAPPSGGMDDLGPFTDALQDFATRRS